MDAYKIIENLTAEKHGAVANNTRKSIGDFLLEGDLKKPVNVKSNNINNNNYSPNIISAKKLIKWLQQDGNELFFIFVNYDVSEHGPIIIDDSGLIPVHHLSWNCLTIEAQGWGVIQMCKKLEINNNQDMVGFFLGMRKAYETFIDKETKKMEKIRKLISDF